MLPGLTANIKVYDGTTTATISSNNVSLLGVLADDTANVKLSTNGYTASFGTAAVGTSKAITLSVLSLTGSAAVNYLLTQPAGLTANITAKALTAQGTLALTGKVYDGTTTATPTGTAALPSTETAGSGTTADGKPYSVDAVSLTGTVAYNFNSKDVAIATTVTESGLSLTGAGNGNYTLTAPTLSATITAKALTVSGITAPSTTYDGTTTAKLGGAAAFLTAETAGSGNTADGKPYSVDSVSPAGTAVGTLAARNVGAEAVTITGVTVTGTGNGNYTVTQQTWLVAVSDRQGADGNGDIGDVEQGV